MMMDEKPLFQNLKIRAERLKVADEAGVGDACRLRARDPRFARSRERRHRQRHHDAVVSVSVHRRAAELPAAHDEAAHSVALEQSAPRWLDFALPALLLAVLVVGAGRLA